MSSATPSLKKLSYICRLLVRAPVLVDLLGEVVSVSVSFSLQCKRVKAELDIVLRVEIYEFVSLNVFLVLFLALIDLDWLLTPHLIDHDDTVVVKLNLLAMRLVILSECVPN